MNRRRQPVAGATVTLRNAQGESVAETTTAEDGRFRFNGLHQGQYAVSANHPAYSGRSKTVYTLAGYLGVKITLQSIVHLSGRVVDAQGEPIAGAKVRVEPLGRLRTNLYGISQSSEGVTTDTFGLFQFSQVPLGDLEVGAAKPGYAPAVATLRVQSLSDRQDVVELRLEKGESLHVQVVDDTGTPVPEADIQLGDYSSYSANPPGHRRRKSERFMGRTDAAGRLRLEDLGRTEIRLMAHAPGFAPAFKAFSVNAGKPEQTMQIRLKRGAALSGSVSLDGTPVNSTNISVVAVGLKSVPRARVHVEAGKYIAQGLLPGTVDVQLSLATAREGDRIFVKRRLELKEEEQATANFEWTAGACALEGHTSLNGEPYPMQLRIVYSDGETSAEYWTGSGTNGYFRLDALPQGSASLHAITPSGKIVRQLTLRPGDLVREDVHLLPERAKIQVSLEPSMPESSVQIFLLEELPEFTELNGVVLEKLEDSSLRSMEFVHRREGIWESVPPGTYSVMGIETRSWTLEDLAEARTSSATVVVHPAYGTAKVNLQF